MAKLHTYQEFIASVNELGFMTLSTLLEGLPSLSATTNKENWHTDNIETDPWIWKDRVAKEKKLVYGCVIGGHKGFISKEYYPVFYAAYHPQESMRSRWLSGKIDKITWDLWQAFEGKESLSTSEIRKILGITKKNGGSKLDTSIKKLQSEFYITVVGNKRKLNKQLQPYGWPSTAFAKVDDYLATEWLNNDMKLSKSDAIDIILNRAVQINANLNKDSIAKKFRF